MCQAGTSPNSANRTAADSARLHSRRCPGPALGTRVRPAADTSPPGKALLHEVRSSCVSSSTSSLSCPQCTSAPLRRPAKAISITVYQKNEDHEDHEEILFVKNFVILRLLRAFVNS